MDKEGSLIAEKSTRYRLTITGIVQGVGFRPLVYRLAKVYGIKGSVLNSAAGVIIDAEGEGTILRQFLSELRASPPPLSRIIEIAVNELPPAGHASFEILDSLPAHDKECIVPPDVAACPQCRHDILSLRDRHYLYPFTNCTNCGPRFSITGDMPYDRRNTSMRAFEMCGECAEEYHNPLDRRFHAQPVACPSCGPHISVTDREGKRIAADEKWLETCWDLLGKGKILALKGVGGFHLACDARNQDVLGTLRARKGRDAKPFAVMCRDLKAAQRYCLINKEEKTLLASPQAPIVIVPKKRGCDLPDELAPGLHTLGILLPYSPHHMLLFNGPFDLLVMTSGNYSNMPLATDNAQALSELGHIADYFLFHNRDIVNRCDDSLIQAVDGEIQFLRRSRGYVPQPFSVVREHSAPVVLGIGGEMKNNFCLLKKDQAFMSQYIGEIDTLEGERNLFESLRNFEHLIGAEPEILAFDLHPDYASARLARTIPAASHIGVQHHHAHFASCMAENGLGNEELIGAILDGTGYGTDGHLWGFEIMTGNYRAFERRLRLAYVPLPGGENAIREPWRTAYAFLVTFLGDEGREFGRMLFKDKDLDTLDQLISKRFNTPLASSCGRLFDAVSAILGICLINTYEGQAAIELGEYATQQGDCSALRPYPYLIEDGVIMPGLILAGIVADRLSDLPLHRIAGRFHLTVAGIVRDCVEQIGYETGLRKVALSGGTWQNRLLFRETKKTLTELGFEVLYHRQVPANDGGIALGQAMIAHWRWKEGCV